MASSQELEAWLLRSATPDSRSLQTDRSSASAPLGAAGDFSGSVKEGARLSVAGAGLTQVSPSWSSVGGGRYRCSVAPLVFGFLALLSNS